MFVRKILRACFVRKQDRDIVRGKTCRLQPIHNLDSLGLVPYETKNCLCHMILLRCMGSARYDFQLALHIGRPRDLLGFGFNGLFLVETLHWTS